MPQFFILLLLAIILAGCGQQYKVAVDVDHEPIGKSDSSVASSAVEEKSSSSESKLEEGELFTDSRDGKKYKTVKIGNQTWMAKNLNYGANGSKCYDNKPANCDKYGRLYDWQTALKACPKGWHLPSNDEWDELYRFADGTSDNTESPYIGKTAGKYLKSASGFSAMLGGIGHYDDSFDNAGFGGFWWSTNEYDHDSYAYNRHIIGTDNAAYWSYNDKSNLFSVRCLKN